MKDALEALVGPVEHFEPVRRGYTPAERVVVRLGDGRSVFAKRAVDEMTAEWLRREHEVYQALGEQPFIPVMIGWADGDRPLLVMEDLSYCLWPPPWDRGKVELVLQTLAAVASCAPPLPLMPLEEAPDLEEGWQRVLDEPDEFLALGMCSRRWLDHAGPLLRDAAAGAAVSGSAFLHCDVRSDNLCFRGDRAVLVDWDMVSRGDPRFDVAFWLPSLAAEGGPLPEEVMPDCPPALAALVAGFFAYRAGRPTIPTAPMVRRVQRQQLATALPWAARVLDLEPPG